MLGFLGIDIDLCQLLMSVYVPDFNKSFSSALTAHLIQGTDDSLAELFNNLGLQIILSEEQIIPPFEQDTD